MMDCGGMVTSSAGSRIPVQFVADSRTSGDVIRKLDGINTLRPRYQRSRDQQPPPRMDGLATSINGTASPPSSLPRHIDDSVETLFREWDSGLRSRTETTLAVRPLTVAPGRDGRRSRQRDRGGAATAPAGSRRAASSSGVDDSLRRSETTSTSGGTGGGYSSEEEDSVEDGSSSVVSKTRSVSTRSPGADVSSPRTYRVEFDVEGYDVDDISARLCPDRRLVVQGIRRQTDAGRTSTTEFCRKIRLPDDVDAARLDCFLQPDGRVVVEAPRQPRRPPSEQPFHVAGSEPLNVPAVGGEDRRQLSLSVEVGRLFRADDVVVKVKNSALTLTVAAERCQQAGEVDGTPSVLRRGRLQAAVTWEFDLPGAVDVDTLRAGLTVDGLLRVTARLSSSLPPPDINTAV